MARWCKLCGRDRDDPEEHQQLAKGMPHICALEFTVANTTTGKPRPAHPSTQPLGLQRTRENRAAFIHESRL